MQLVQAASQPTYGAGSDSNAVAAAKLAMEGIAVIHFVRAHKNTVAARAAGGRMHELEEALKDPLKRPRAPEAEDYLTIIRPVKNRKMMGQFITAPDRVEYRDERKSLQLTCDEVRGVSGGGKTSIHYTEVDSGGRKKKHKQTLQLKAENKGDRKLLVTDVYLACPRLTE